MSPVGFLCESEILFKEFYHNELKVEFQVNSKNALSFSIFLWIWLNFRHLTIDFFIFATIISTHLR